MKDVQKLKRGLKDVSPRFFSLVSYHAAEEKRANRPDARAAANQFHWSAGDPIPAAHCLSILPAKSGSDLLHRPLFLRAIQAIFAQVCLVRSDDSEFTCRLTADGIRHVVIPSAQIHKVLHPAPAKKGAMLEAESERHRVAFFFDAEELFEREREILQIVDHGILHVTTDSSESLLAAYQSFVACLALNPSLHFSLLVEGAMAEETAELIYEQFAKIASRFVSHEIGFLGWMDEQSIRLNEELLLNLYQVHPLMTPLKRRLAQTICEELLAGVS